MNIHQILNEGQGLVLNSVTCKQDYGLKAGQTPHRAVLIEDVSGKTIIKIWGATANQGFEVGEIFTVQGVGQDGNIKMSEYQGKKSLNANSCEIIRGGTTQSVGHDPAPAASDPTIPTLSNPPPIATAPSNLPNMLNPEQLADAQAAHFGRIAKRLAPLAGEIGASGDTIMLVAAQMTGSASDWWFGAKYPGCRD